MQISQLSSFSVNETKLLRSTCPSNCRKNGKAKRTIVRSKNKTPVNNNNDNNNKRPPITKTKTQNPQPLILIVKAFLHCLPFESGIQMRIIVRSKNNWTSSPTTTATTWQLQCKQTNQTTRTQLWQQLFSVLQILLIVMNIHCYCSKRMQ